MTQRSGTVVGVFDERAMADRAVEALQSAGFSGDQIRYSGTMSSSDRGGFLASLKSLFTGEDTGSDNIRRDFKEMGFSQEEADYYANEFNAGHGIVAVNASGRQSEAMNLLRANGARDYDLRTTATGASGYAQSTGSTYATTNDATAYDQTRTDRTDYATSDYDQARATNRTDYATSNYDQARDTAAYGDQPAYTQGSAYDETRDTTTYSNQAAYDQNVDRSAYDRDVDTDENRNLRLREERLEADKNRVQAGEVRLHKDVVEEQQSINVPVTHEEVYIKRHDAGAGQVSDTPIGQDETIRVPVSEEQVNVTKTPYVTGEVSVGKRAVQENREFSDTVRREEARVEREGDPNLRTDNIDNA